MSFLLVLGTTLCRNLRDPLQPFFYPANLGFRPFYMFGFQEPLSLSSEWAGLLPWQRCTTDPDVSRCPTLLTVLSPLVPLHKYRTVICNFFPPRFSKNPLLPFFSAVPLLIILGSISFLWNSQAWYYFELFWNFSHLLHVIFIIKELNDNSVPIWFWSWELLVA